MTERGAGDGSPLHHAPFAVRDGTADPQQARRLIEMFCEYLDAGQHPPDWLMEHTRASFRRFLDGERKRLDQAFGLSGRKGNPLASSERERIAMAGTVVKHRLAGGPHQDALASAERELGYAITTIGAAFREYLDDGIAWLSVRRAGAAWTDAEKRTLAAIRAEADRKWKERESSPGDTDRLHPERRPRPPDPERSA